MLHSIIYLSQCATYYMHIYYFTYISILYLKMAINCVQPSVVVDLCPFSNLLYTSQIKMVHMYFNNKNTYHLHHLSNARYTIFLSNLAKCAPKCPNPILEDKITGTAESLNTGCNNKCKRPIQVKAQAYTRSHAHPISSMSSFIAVLVNYYKKRSPISKYTIYVTTVKSSIPVS